MSCLLNHDKGSAWIVILVYAANWLLQGRKAPGGPRRAAFLVAGG